VSAKAQADFRINLTYRRDGCHKQVFQTLLFFKTEICMFITDCTIFYMTSYACVAAQIRFLDE